MSRIMKSNPALSWWGPRNVMADIVVPYQCPTNLTADSDFNASTHCPANSFGDPLDFTTDTDLALASSEYTTVD